MSVEAHDEEIDLGQIADTVLHRALPDPEAKRHRIEESAVLTYGAKKLIVWVDTVDKRISTNIETDDGDPKPCETTILYLAANKFMQRTVDDLGTTYWYQLQSKNERIKNWARTAGNDIFHWTNLSEVPNGEDIYASFETTFFPKNHGLDQEIS